jgi:alpha,alpha-trehalase
VFQEALLSDVVDIQGGTTPEGVHLGLMAGTVDVRQRCDTGLELRGDVLWLGESRTFARRAPADAAASVPARAVS